MRGSWLLLCLAVAGCSSATERSSSTTLTGGSCDATMVDRLSAEGGAAARAGEWSEAARAFSAAHACAGKGERGELAFLWGFSLYKMAEAQAKADTEATRASLALAHEGFRQARSILEVSEHPMRDRVLHSIEVWLRTPRAYPIGSGAHPVGRARIDGHVVPRPRRGGSSPHG